MSTIINLVREVRDEVWDEVWREVSEEVWEEVSGGEVWSKHEQNN